MLRESARVVMETHEIGVNVVGTMHDQRETLLRSNTKVRCLRERLFVTDCTVMSGAAPRRAIRPSDARDTHCRNGTPLL